MDSNSLEVVDVADVELPVPAYSEAKAQWKKYLSSISSGARSDALEDWTPGEEILLTRTDLARVISSSSNFSMDLSETLLRENERHFTFADHDSRQDIIVDLGCISSISNIRANFATSLPLNRAGVSMRKLSGDLYYCGRQGDKGTCCGPIGGPQCNDCSGYTRNNPPRENAPDRSVQGPIIIRVSADNKTFYDWKNVSPPTVLPSKCFFHRIYC